jgi:hypothetical protein
MSVAETLSDWNSRMDEKNKKRGSNSSEQTLGEINYANAEYHQLYDEKQNLESEDAGGGDQKVSGGEEQQEEPDVSAEKSKALAVDAASDVTNKSSDWSTVGNVSKCNLYVHDKLLKQGMNPYENAISAGEWGNPNKVIPHWKIVTDPQPGDIAAYRFKYSHATGHVGIVGKPTLGNSPTLIYAGSSVYKYIVRSAISSFNISNWVYRRYTAD